MSQPFRVVALLAAYNEADIIAQVVSQLIADGVDVHFIDTGSTDGTVAEVESFVGKGVVAIEQFAGQVGAGGRTQFQWERILKRKEELARTIDAHWFIHQDADEFREGPWRGRTLAESIQSVDDAGYNAIDFAVLNFWPTHDRFKAGDDVRESFRHFEPGKEFDRLQVKCWKKTNADVDLATSGGHDATFPGRRVFPIRFLLRHYPIRGQAHGLRKVLQERQARFDPEERSRGWHVQYDAIGADHRFIRDPGSLTPYDPDVVRLHLSVDHRLVESLRADHAEAERTVLGLRTEIERARDGHAAQSQEIDRLKAEGILRARDIAWLIEKRDELQTAADRHATDAGRLAQEVTALTSGQHQLRSELDDVRRQLEAAARQCDQAIADLATARRDLSDLTHSLAWRITGPLRWLLRRRERRDR